MKSLFQKYIVQLFLCFSLSGISTLLYAAEAIDTIVITSKDVYSLANHLRWMQSEEQLSPDRAYQLLKEGRGQLLSSTGSINPGFTTTDFWLTFTVVNDAEEERSLFYKFNYPFVKSIDIYKETPIGFENILQTGAERPFDSRGYIYHDFVLPIRLSKGERSSFLIRAERKGERFSISPELISESAFKKEEQFTYIIIGIIVGIMFFNIVINLFLGISLADKIHYLYAAYVLATLAWVFSSVGLDYQFLFPDYPAIFKISQFVAGAITMLLMAQLAVVFLKLKQHSLVAYYSLYVFKGLLILVLLAKVGLYMLHPQQGFLNKVISNSYMLAIAGIAFSITWAAIICVRKGFKPAWFYLAAIVYLTLNIISVCYVILVTNNLSILMSPPTSIQIGLIVESLIIFASIIYRYAVLKKERENLELKLIDQKIAMTQNIMAAQEEERKRLAQDLHDDLGATLSTLLLHITNKTEPWLNSPYQERTLAITQKALVDLRHISHDLLPKDFATIHLFQALRNRVDELYNFTATRFWLNMDGDDRFLHENQSINLYRIVNELINNAIKHAKASQVNIDLVIADKEITLVFEDDGIGFTESQSQKGIGLKNIHSRVAFLNGKINIDNNNQGTTIIIDIPL